MRYLMFPVSLLLGLFLLAGCGHGAADGHAHHGERADGHASHEAENPGHHHGDEAGDRPAAAPDPLARMTLDDGRKWAMDEHTRLSFEKMSTSFLESDHRALEGDGLRQAGAALRTDIDDLIRGCTMTGKAHDQLHVYLMGYIPAVTALTQSGKAEDAREVARYLESYGDYFE